MDAGKIRTSPTIAAIMAQAAGLGKGSSDRKRKRPGESLAELTTALSAIPGKESSNAGLQHMCLESVAEPPPDTTFGVAEHMRCLVNMFSVAGTTLPSQKDTKPALDQLRTLCGAHLAAASLASAIDSSAFAAANTSDPTPAAPTSFAADSLGATGHSQSAGATDPLLAKRQKLSMQSPALAGFMEDGSVAVAAPLQSASDSNWSSLAAALTGGAGLAGGLSLPGHLPGGLGAGPLSGGLGAGGTSMSPETAALMTVRIRSFHAC